jgi:phospholipid transport system substrate-binding protein
MRGCFMKKVVFFSLILFCFGISNTYAEEPADTLKLYINKTIELFKSYDSNNTSKEYKMEFEDKVLNFAEEIFAFEIMSRMVLGRYWRQLTAHQRDEFQCLFIELIAQNYFDKVLQHVEEIKKYPAKNIEIIGQTLFSARKAEVRTRIKYQDKYIPVNYRFLFINNKWKIYDVYIEGVSLIKNYRSQFKDLFMKKAASKVIEELKAKLKDSWCKRKHNSANRLMFRWLCGKCIAG